MTHRDKFEFVNELCSTTNREFACAIWRRLATPEPRESIALYVWDFPSARVWLVLYSRTQGNIIMWRTPYFYLMRSHTLIVLTCRWRRLLQ